MDILIIGSGAVGAIYGQALVAAKCHVTFLVRNKASANAQMPRELHQFNWTRGWRSQQQNLPVIDNISDHYDQVWLCTPSTALQDPWLAEQITKLGHTPLIAWTPDIADIHVLKKWHTGPITQALIGLVSYQTPLPESAESAGKAQPQSGIAYVLPPGSAVLHNSEEGVVAAKLLRAGGVPSQTRGDLVWWEARLECTTLCMVAALEQCDWSISELRRSGMLKRVSAAAKEAALGCAMELGVKPGLYRYIPIKGLLSMVGWIAPKLSPFPLQTYLQYHFTKVGDQTRDILDNWIMQCERHNSSCEQLMLLRQGLK